MVCSRRKIKLQEAHHQNEANTQVSWDGSRLYRMRLIEHKGQEVTFRPPQFDSERRMSLSTSLGLGNEQTPHINPNDHKYRASLSLWQSSPTTKRGGHSGPAAL